MFRDISKSRIDTWHISDKYSQNPNFVFSSTGPANNSALACKQCFALQNCSPKFCRVHNLVLSVRLNIFPNLPKQVIAQVVVNFSTKDFQKFANLLPIQTEKPYRNGNRIWKSDCKVCKNLQIRFYARIEKCGWIQMTADLYENATIILHALNCTFAKICKHWFCQKELIVFQKMLSKIAKSWNMYIIKVVKKNGKP